MDRSNGLRSEEFDGELNVSEVHLGYVVVVVHCRG